MKNVVGKLDDSNNKDKNNQIRREALELPLVDLSTIMKATNNFSLENKIGAGGFGKVFKVRISTKKQILFT